MLAITFYKCYYSDYIKSRKGAGITMQISSRFTMGVHILTCMAVLKDQMPMNSDTIAASVGTNRVIIRKLFGQLKEAGLITAQKGNNGGVALAKPVSDINLLEIYKAVDSIPDNTLFHFHENPSTLCPVGRNMHRVMDGRLEKAQKSLEDTLEGMSLSDVINDTEHWIALQEKEA